MGLHLQLHQEVYRVSRVCGSRPRSGGHAATLYEQLRAVVDQDLPQVISMKYEITV